MTAQAQGCDHQRIDNFLNSHHVGLEDPQLVEHLDSCEACREYMEKQAATQEGWTTATELLRPTEFDKAGAAEYSAATIGHKRVDQPVAIQNVLDALSPSEDPHRLGRLGGYEVVGVVGVGGMGVVLKVIDPALDRVVAIKVMAPHLAHNATARKRFSREAKAAAAVLHPNVVPIHSVSSDEATPYLVMAYIRGGSLQKRLEQEGPLPTVEILRIGSQVAAGLAAAHEQGLVHRDIKPENILLEEGVERVTITDFGLARTVDDASLTRDGTIAGTPQYMSPEQARGESVDQASDLFSLGSVLYALCTGRPPFRAESSFGVMRRISDSTPSAIRELNPEIPEWLAGIVDKLMAKDQADRFASAAELHKLLDACLSHVQQPTAAELPADLPKPSPVTPLPEPQGRSRRERTRTRRFVAIAALFVAVIVAAAVYYIQTDNGIVRVEVADPSLKLTISDQTISTENDGKPLTIRAGEHTLIVQQGDLQFETNNFKISRGDKVELKVDLLAGEVVVIKDGDRAAAWKAHGPSNIAVAPEIAMMLETTGQSRDEFLNKLANTLSQAAGIPNAEFEKLATSRGPIDPKKVVEGEPLSLVLLMTDPFKAAAANPAALKDFRLTTDGMPKPNELAEAMTPSQEHGYVSVIQPEYIKGGSLRINAAAQALRGSVEFEAPDLYEGCVDFLMKYEGGRMRPIEFSLPAYGIQVALDENSVWHRHRLAISKPSKTGEFTISQATTFVTEPITDDGYPDYAAAMKQRLGSGVTAENNANVLFMQAQGPGSEDERLPAEYFDLIGMKPLAESGDYFQSLSQYLQSAKLDDGDETPGDIEEQLRQAVAAPWTADKSPRISLWLKANKAPLALIIEGTKRSHYYSPIVSMEQDKNKERASVLLKAPGPRGKRDFARALAARAMNHLAEGRIELAWQDLLACHRLGRLIGQGPALVEAFIGYGIEDMATTATHTFIEHAQPSSDQARRYYLDLQSLPPVQPIASKIDLGERFMFLDSTMHLIRKVTNGEEVTDMGPLIKSLSKTSSIDWDTTLRLGNERYGRAVKLLESGDREEIKAFLDAMMKEFEEAAKLPAIAKLLTNAENPEKASGKMMEQVLASLLFPDIPMIKESEERAARSRQNLQVAFAVAAYRADHRRYPKSLDELVPRYLPDAPNAVRTGQPLAYRPTARGYELDSVEYGLSEPVEAADEIERRLEKIHGDLTPKFQTMLSEAAGIPNGQWASFAADSAASANAIQGDPLSLVLWQLEPLKESTKNLLVLKDFQYVGGVPKPAELSAAKSASRVQGYHSMLQPEYITGLTYEIKSAPLRSAMLNGSFRFQAPKLYAGKINFVVHVNADTDLQVTEFTLPNYGIRLVRDQDGLWHRQESVSNITSSDAVEKVSATALVNGCEVRGSFTKEQAEISIKNPTRAPREVAFHYQIVYQDSHKRDAPFQLKAGEYQATVRAGTSALKRVDILLDPNVSTPLNYVRDTLVIRVSQEPIKTSLVVPIVPTEKLDITEHPVTIASWPSGFSNTDAKQFKELGEGLGPQGPLRVHPQTGEVRQASDVETAANTIKALLQILDVYKVEHGDYPTTEAGWKALSPLVKKVPVDPWGNTYRYEFPPAGGDDNSKPRIWSLGPDGKDKTADDIRSWQVTASNTTQDTSPQFVLDQVYKILDNGKELGNRRVVVTKTGQTLSIEQETSLALEFAGQRGIVEVDATVSYSLADDYPRLAYGKASVKEDASLVMTGTFTAEEGKVAADWKAFKEGGTSLDSPKDETATVDVPSGPVVHEWSIHLLGPLLLPKEGERKVVWGKFPGKRQGRRALVEFEPGYRLQRKKRTADPGFLILLFEPKADKPEVTLEYDAVGKCERMSFGSTIVLIPHKANEGKTSEVDRKRTESQIQQLDTALKLYMLDHGSYPTTAEGLQSLVQRPADEDRRRKWNGPYLEKLGKDPWGNTYGYQSPAKNGDTPRQPRIWSNGRDGKQGTADDINNWEEESDLRSESDDGSVESLIATLQKLDNALDRLGTGSEAKLAVPEVRRLSREIRAQLDALTDPRPRPIGNPLPSEQQCLVINQCLTSVKSKTSQLDALKDAPDATVIGKNLDQVLTDAETFSKSRDDLNRDDKARDQVGTPR